MKKDWLVFGERGVRLPLPMLDLEEAHELGISFWHEGRPLGEEEILREGVPPGTVASLGEWELPVEALEYRLERAVELLGGGEVEGTPRHEVQDLSLVLEHEEDPLPWLQRAAHLGRAFARFKGRGRPQEPEGEPHRWADLWALTEGGDRRFVLRLRMPTPLVPFFLEALRTTPVPKELPEPRRGLFVGVRTERGFLIGKVARREREEVYLEAAGEVRAFLASALLPLPRGVRAYSWFGLLKGEVFERGYDHLLLRLERELGFQRPRVTTFYAPFQLEAEDPEGRAVYFRERGGQASLSLTLEEGVSLDAALQEGRFLQVCWPGDWFEQGDHEDTFRVIAALYAQARGFLEARLREDREAWRGFWALPEGFLFAPEGRVPEGAEERLLERGVVGLYLKGRLVGVRVRPEEMREGY